MKVYLIHYTKRMCQKNFLLKKKKKKKPYKIALFFFRELITVSLLICDSYMS